MFARRVRLHTLHFVSPQLLLQVLLASGSSVSPSDSTVVGRTEAVNADNIHTIVC